MAGIYVLKNNVIQVSESAEAEGEMNVFRQRLGGVAEEAQP